jgi:hypothetical protein
MHCITFQTVLQFTLVFAHLDSKEIEFQVTGILPQQTWHKLNIEAFDSQVV